MLQNSSFQIIFKLTQSFFQRFVGGANSPDSKSLTVWYALSHMRRMTAARKKVLIGVGRFVTMITMVLKKNNFTFNGDHYLQINGTAMGTKMAPSYANIFM
jgi:hypothetical protein